MQADNRELRVGRSESVEVFVHGFQIVQHRETSRADSAPPTTLNAQGITNGTISKTSLLQAGSQVAREAVSEAGWKHASQTESQKFRLNPDACFIWAKEPPQLSRQERSIQEHIQLRAWGESVEEEEIVRLNALGEFNHAVYPNELARNTTAVKRHAEVDNVTEGRQPRKKRKWFSGSLHGIIKPPYFYSSTFITTMRGQPAPVPPYVKGKPIPIPPYSEGVTQPLRPLAAIFRTAWIIPIRGMLPWNTCTPAVILEDGDGVGKEGNWIQWTKTALTSFWAFLLSIREAGKLGQVGISFHVATAREREASLSADTINELYSSSMDGMDELQVSSLPLSAADYVKVYHEASNAMTLRNILDAWAYVCPGGRKVRVLKGSKLVLVDERSNAMLVS